MADLALEVPLVETAALEEAEPATPPEAVELGHLDKVKMAG